MGNLTHPPAKIPKALSKGEECLALHLKTAGIEFEREVRFAPPRKWRFDFLLKEPLTYPPLRIAIEVDGGTARGASRHSFGKGYEKDTEKQNTAAVMGFYVLIFTTRQVVSGEAIKFLREMLQ